jgi:uncharacterized protein YdaT
MTDIRDGSFWSGLLRKILKIITKSAGINSRPTTHHQHVVPHDEGWAIKGEGNERYTGIFERQSQAIDRAREIATNYGSDVIIHGRDGAIRDRMSYRKD